MKIMTDRIPHRRGWAHKPHLAKTLITLEDVAWLRQVRGYCTLFGRPFDAGLFAPLIIQPMGAFERVFDGWGTYDAFNDHYPEDVDAWIRARVKATNPELLEGL